mmetsp:Transcript_8817/g.8720  ORF Transcript_8817/g.8720 Transcript_8817/m.8720 type:complete len:900 (+) Transcript_8817:244-2943(+)
MSGPNSSMRIQDSSAPSMASTFQSTKNTAKSADDLKKARETRAAEALRMKDEQLKILSDQNASLLATLDKVEEESSYIQTEKLQIEQENRGMRDQNFELQSKSRAAETQAKRMTTEVADKDKQLRIMTDQNSELLRLLESEESLTASLQAEVAEYRTELDETRQKHSALLTTARSYEEMSTMVAREGQLRGEEVRILRAESEQLRQQNGELKMKTMVEVDALQEQLRVRKEKQYQLLEKLQAQEEAKRQAEDQLAGMEDQLRSLHARNVELDTQLQVEARIKLSFEETNKELTLENSNIFNENKEVQIKIEKSERERLRMEAETRDSGEQLREMAEKVFQLLERLKLAELSKTKALESLKKKEQDVVGLQKKSARLIKESTEDGKIRMKLELDVKVLQEQIRALKKSNQDLAQRSKEEASGKVKVTEEAEQLQEKLKTMDSRLSFLLNKVQMDEESRVLMMEDRKKLEAQVMSYTEKCKELQKKLLEMGESNRIITQAMRLKQEEVSELSARYDAVKREIDEREAKDAEMDFPNNRNGGTDDLDNGQQGQQNEGRKRFFVDAKVIVGGSLLLLKGRKPAYKDWLDKHGTNDFLKRAQKSQRFKDIMVEKIAQLYSLLMVEEEEKASLLETIENRDKTMEHLQNKMIYIQDGLAVEEDAKRRMLLRYIHSVKEQASSSSDGAGGVLNLPESNISDEEIHALAALLRNNTNIEELNLRGNIITDDGARALGAVLAGKSALRLIDLRGNRIGKGAIRILAEALERSERVRHVYVHAGGKIEALGTNPDRLGVTGGTGTGVTTDPVNTAVETVCVVDVRDNTPSEASQAFELMTMERNFNTGKVEESSKNTKFAPIMLLESNGLPSKGDWDSSTGTAAGLNSVTGGKIKDLIMKKKKKKKEKN